MFADPPPSSPLDTYTKSYFAGGNDGFGYVDYERDKLPMIGSFERYLVAIESHSGGRGCLFDVGAATGFFLSLAKKRGWQVRGVEPCAYAANIASKKGLDVETGVLTGQEAAVDVVTAFDVIEHMPDPRSFIRTVKQVLKPGGLLAINTPDSGSAIARLFGVRWHAVLPPEHLQLFNRRSLELLLQQEGFDMIEVRWIGKRFTVPYILQTLSRWTTVKLLSRAASSLSGGALGRSALPVNLGDNLFVLARVR